MEIGAVPVDNQPVSASFFGEGNWLTDYITPDNPNIQMLFREITTGITNPRDKIVACWDWVATQVRYKAFITARIQIENKVSRTGDYWQMPALCAQTRVGNCANKAFLLTSLLRNVLAEDQVYCTLGNLYNGHATGHAWVEIVFSGQEYIVEATRDDVPMIKPEVGDRYEPVHYFNESMVYAIEGRTLMTPFQACYSTWLRDYLNWTYINRMGEQ